MNTINDVLGGINEPIFPLWLVIPVGCWACWLMYELVHRGKQTERWVERVQKRDEKLRLVFELLAVLNQVTADVYSQNPRESLDIGSPTATEWRISGTCQGLRYSYGFGGKVEISLGQELSGLLNYLDARRLLPDGICKTDRLIFDLEGSFTQNEIVELRKLVELKKTLRELERQHLN